jgi:hypothetical protein
VPQQITADEELRYPIPIYDRLVMNLAFACPMCQLAGTLVEMHTDDALRMHWSNDPHHAGSLKITWTGCRCPKCQKSFTMEASKIFETGPFATPPFPRDLPTVAGARPTQLGTPSV